MGNECLQTSNCDMHVNYLENTLHDIKTPISIVSIMMQNMRESIELDKEQCHYFDVTKKYISKILDVLQHTNDYAKIVRNGYEPQFEIVDAVLLVEECMAQADAMIKHKNLNVTLETNMLDKYMLLDAKAVDKIMQNLISNATKFTPIGGNIDIAVNEFNGVLNICVSDSGCGFPQKMIEYGVNRYLTEKVYNPNGSGIGLSIVKELANMLGGAVELGKSEQGGAKVMVILPEAKHSEIDVSNEYYGVQLQLM